MDLGYFRLERFQSLSDQRIYWLSRYKSGTLVWDADGVCWELPDLLAIQTTAVVELLVRLGQAGKLACRLLAVRAPQAAPVCAGSQARYDTQSDQPGIGGLDDPDHERSRQVADGSAGGGGRAHTLAN
jgi:hypothetical protein